MSKTHLLRFLALAFIAVVIGPFYFYALLDASKSVISTTSPVAAVQSALKAIVSSDPPRLVLHVGLQKTATSAIQCRLNALERHDILFNTVSAKIVEIESCRPTPFMQNIHLDRYLERFPHVDPNEITNQSVTDTSQIHTTYDRVIKGSSVLQHCIDIWIKTLDSSLLPDCWSKSYQKYIRNYNNQGLSTFVISNENLALPSFGRVANATACGVIFNSMLDSLGDKSEIDIVLTYRLHFDRMISFFGQSYDGEMFYYAPKLMRWPSQGGKAVPYLEEYINSFPVDQLVQAINCFHFASKNPRIRFKVIDFHNKQPGVVTSFMQVVTKNSDITQQLADTNAFIGKVNTAMERDNKIQFDRIAIAAKRAGLLNNALTRYDVRNAVSKHFQDKGLKITDAKLKCPQAKFFHDLVNTSAMIHQLLFPDEPPNKVYGRLRMFDIPQFRDIFCEVDGNETLFDGIMQSFVEESKHF